MYTKRPLELSKLDTKFDDKSKPAVYLKDKTVKSHWGKFH